jgi:membrane-associated phospholipid phosphatase
VRLPTLLAFAAVTLSVCAAENAWASDPPSVVWRDEWPRFSTAEGVFTAGFALQSASTLLLYPDPEPNWRGGILYDNALRGLLRSDSRSGREAASSWSDAFYYSLAVYPTLVDVVIVADHVHHAPDVAGEMMAINLEAYALAGAISLTAQQVGRVRPLSDECARDAAYGKKCSDPADLNSSFLSGHTAIAFTSAGLTCAHHQHLPLYGGGAPDLLACLSALSLASATGALRVMSDNHYATDVTLGMGVGLLAGYVMPSVLHYGFGSGPPRSTTLLPTFRTGSGATATNWLLAPTLNPGLKGVALIGTF